MQIKLKNKPKKLNKLLLFSVCLVVGFIWLKLRAVIADKNNFPDEIDNFTVGWLMTQNKTLYKDIFVHHFPFIYFVAFALEHLAHNYLVYRYFMIAYELLFWAVIILLLKKDLQRATVACLPLVAWSLIFFGGQQFTSETFFAYSLIGFYLLFLNKLLYSPKKFDFSKFELLLLAWFFITTILSSLIYFLSFIPFFLFYLAKKRRANKKEAKKIIRYFCLPVAAASILIFLYLAINQAVSTAIWSLFVFNSRYYSLRYDLSQNSIPAFLIKLLADYSNHFYQLLVKALPVVIIYLKSIKGVLSSLLTKNALASLGQNLFVIHRELYNNLLNFELFVAIFLVLGLLALLKRKKYLAVLLTLAFSFGSRLRYGEMFYASGFYILSFWLIVFYIVTFLKNFRVKNIVPLSLGILILILYFIKMKPVYKFATSFHIKDEHPQTTDFIIKNTLPEDKIFQINLGSSIYYYTLRLPPGKFIFYYPWIDWTPSLQKEALEDIHNKKAKLVLVDADSIQNFQDQGQNIYKKVISTIEENYYYYPNSLTEKTLIYSDYQKK